MSGPHVLIVLQNEPYPYDRRVRQQAEALVAGGYRVTVAGPTGFGFEAAEETIDGVRAVRYAGPRGGRGVVGYLREYALAMLRLRRLVAGVRRRERVDVLLVCSPPFLVLLALPRRGAGIVLDFDDLYPELYEAKFGRRDALHRLLLAVERFALRRADAVTCPNASYAEVAATRGGVAPGRIFVVGNGPDPGRIFPVEPRPELRHGRSRLVLWVGMMSRQEGLERLIEAADELVNLHGRRDVTFALVGPGDAHEELARDAERRGLDGSVVFPGRVEDELLRAYMATADVCVSVDERGGMNDRSTMTKVLEYMTMARPVVQFPLPEMQRTCGDATLYARNADSSDLAAKIAQLLEDPEERERLGARGRQRVLSGGLTWPDQVPSLLAAVRAARPA